MYIDILIFAVIAAFLIYRLSAVLGTRHGSERQRQNPFAVKPEQVTDQAQSVGGVQALPPAAAIAAAVDFQHLIDEKANADGRIDTGLAEIAEADAGFNVHRFMEGARAAFEMIVTSYAKGDLEVLKSLLSPKLFADFAAGIAQRQAAGQTMELIIHRIKTARIIEAHLGGTMAYITVDFDVEETTVTRDREGQVVDGNPDRIFSVEDIWTFTRDTRANDPNWVLIETRAVES